jgi:uncharacterized protein YdaU (DUF1376 family)
MPKAKPEWFKFFAQQWLSSSSVRTMTLAERGAYIGLLASAWVNSPTGTLPNNLEELRLLAGADVENWPNLWKSLEKHFPLCGKLARGRRINPKLFFQGRAYRRFQALQRGRIKSRWDKEVDATGKNPVIPARCDTNLRNREREKERGIRDVGRQEDLILGSNRNSAAAAVQNSEPENQEPEIRVAVGPALSRNLAELDAELKRIAKAKSQLR